MCQCNNGSTFGSNFYGNCGNVGGVGSDCGCGCGNNNGYVGGANSDCGCGCGNNGGNVGGVGSDCDCGNNNHGSGCNVLSCAACGIFKTVMRIVNGIDNSLCGCNRRR